MPDGERMANRVAKAEQGIAVVQAQYQDLKDTMLKEFANVNIRLDRQNGNISDLERFKIQAQAILALLAFLLGSGFLGGAVMALMMR